MTTAQLQQSQPLTSARTALSKVPEVTAYFWITKVLTTGMGETTSDYFAKLIDPAIAVCVAGLVLAGTLALQLTAKRYVTWIYWATVVMVSVFGTMAADALHVVVGVPYTVSTAFFVVALGAIFVAWYLSEKTLSIHSIHTKRRELFYWSAVMATFALGTAVGDLTAVTLKLGYFDSGLLFAVLIAIPALGAWWFRLNAIFAFWFAYIVTRPLGASFADWIGVPHSRRGLGFGTGPISLVLAVMIVGFVAYLTVSRKDVAAQA